MMFMSLHIVVAAVVMAHILLRPHRQPESRAAWLVLVLTLPYAGALAYLFLGQTNVGRKRVERLKAAFHTLPPPSQARAGPARRRRRTGKRRFSPLAARSAATRRWAAIPPG